MLYTASLTTPQPFYTSTPFKSSLRYPDFYRAIYAFLDVIQILLESSPKIRPTLYFYRKVVLYVYNELEKEKALC